MAEPVTVELNAAIIRGIITVAFVSCFKRQPTESEIAERLAILESENAKN